MPALRVQRAVDRVDDNGEPAVAEDAHLLAHELHVLAAEAVEDHRLGGGVDRGRVVAALAVADHGLALGAARQLGEHARDVVPRGAAELEPVLRHSYRMEEQAGGELRVEERRLLRHRLAGVRERARPARR